MSDRFGEALEETLTALSAPGADALAKAEAEGFPNRDEVIAWAERTQNLVLHLRDRAALRKELPTIAERLGGILGSVNLPPGADPEAIVEQFVRRLPEVRSLLAEDVEAAFEGDPAAKSYAEIVSAYPAMQAISMYRIGHELYRLEVPLIPRIISEHTHMKTGIDIHPGAKIGRRFFIDHGTGVVIGETCEIGDRVVLYQGVTLGALAPRKGQSLRGIKRHPTIQDDVTIYAGATILGGGAVIGAGSVIGGNVWLTDPVPPCSKVQIEPPSQLVESRPGCRDPRDRQLQWDL
jgi:serine O-acetyltransferase